MQTISLINSKKTKHNTFSFKESNVVESSNALMKTFQAVTAGLFSEKQSVLNFIEMPKQFVIQLKDSK